MARSQRDPERERQWRERMVRWQASGLSAREFCRRHGLLETSFYYWKRELRARDAAASTAATKSASGKKSRPTFLPRVAQVPGTPGTCVAQPQEESSCRLPLHKKLAWNPGFWNPQGMMTGGEMRDSCTFLSPPVPLAWDEQETRDGGEEKGQSARASGSLRAIAWEFPDRLEILRRLGTHFMQVA